MPHRPTARPPAGAGAAAAVPAPSLGLGAALAVALTLQAAAGAGSLLWPAILAVLLLGLPHGALDLLLLRRFAQPGLRLAGYLALALATGLAGLAWPAAFFAAFLAVAAWHFGSGDCTEPPLRRPSRRHRLARWLEIAGRGSLPLAAPCALAADATLPLFAAVAAGDAPLFVKALAAAFPLSLAASALCALLRAREAPAAALALAVEMLAVATAFLLLPPLAAFAVYFCGLHAPRHWRRTLGADGRLDRFERTWVALVTGAAVLLVVGAALLAPLAGQAQPGSADSVAVRALVLLLGALTLPHALLVALAAAAESDRAAVTPGRSRRAARGEAIPRTANLL